MTNGQTVVSGNVSGAKAGAAETRLEQRTGFHQLLLHTAAHQLQINGRRRGIYRQREISAADVVAVQNGGSLGNVVIHTAGAAGNHALVHIQLTVYQLVRQMQRHLAAELVSSPLLAGAENIPGIFLQFVNGICLGGVEGQGNHRLHRPKVNGNHAVIVSALFRTELLVFLRSAVERQIFFHSLIGFPNGAEAGGFRGHDVNADAEVHGQVFDAGAGEFQNLVFHKTVFIHRAAQCNGNVMGADALFRGAGEIHQDNLRCSHIISVFQQLLYDFRAALAHAHGTDGTVTGVAVGAENHFAAAAHHFPGILVNDRLIGRNVNAAVFLCGGQTENMVIFIDGAAHGAKAVVTVGHHIGNGKFLQSGGFGGLDNAHIGNIVGNQAVKLDLHCRRVFSGIVGAKNFVSHGLFSGCQIRCGSVNGLSVFPENTVGVK